MGKDLVWNSVTVNDADFYQGISTDIVILGYHDRTLKILLQKPLFSSKWSLAGGFISKNMSVEEAAHEIVRQRTGLEDLELYHFGVYSEPGRINDDKNEFIEFAKNSGLPIDESHWSLGNVISIAFCALIDFEKADQVFNTEMEETRWWDISEIPPLIYDHNRIVRGAMDYLKARCYMKPIGRGLLQDKFTLPDLRSLYETILGKQLDDRNFSKKLLHIGLIERLEERKSIGPHRSPYLYKFNDEVYDFLSRESSFIIMS